MPFSIKYLIITSAKVAVCNFEWGKSWNTCEGSGATAAAKYND